MWLYAGTYVFTVAWAFWEVGTNWWAQVPRLVGPSILLGLVLLCLPVFERPQHTTRGVGAKSAGFVAAGLVLIALGASAFVSYPWNVSSAKAQSAVDQTPDLARPLQRLAPKAPELAAKVAADGSAPSSSSEQGAGLPPGEGAMVQMRSDAGSDWVSWGGTNLSLRYSSLREIDRDNVKNLKLMWTFRTRDLPDSETKNEYPEITPLKIGNRLYLCSPKNKLFALNAATGKAIWQYDPRVPDDAVPYGATCRGVSYYRNPAAGSGDLCAERIIEGTLDARLIAVDAATGAPCPGFGSDGQVDLWRGIGQKVPGWYGNVAAPVIVRGIVVMGGQVQDGQAEDAPSGVIRGYDAVTGKLAWAWDMCRPNLTGEPAPGETFTRGTPNMWASAACNEQLGYVYVPLGNSSVDYYGGNRKACENDYNSSVVAIDVTNGRPVWHFQTVHYDLWDYDLGSQPTLVDFPHAGATVPALILPSKQGQIYVLDRRTGDPLFPVENRKVPTGGVEPQKLSPTQPYSSYVDLTKPALTERDMWGMSPLDQLWCRIQFRKAYYRGEYTPPTTDRHFVEYPSYNGGSDWGSVAVDPKRGILIVNYNDMANYDRLISREEVKKRGLLPVNEPDGDQVPADPGGDPQVGAPYGIEVGAGWRQKWTGLMCKQPPYGGIRGVELATGKTLWDRPFGDARANGPFGIPSMLPIRIGTPNNGGAVVTAGGLAFIAATTDNMFRAIDTQTGKVLWQTKLPAGGQANPITFEANGRQFVAITAGGHHFMKTPVGDYVIAWALPKPGEVEATQ
ncbi:pyrroloquinoline quinone-dependent dehydrogenase [Mesorhizobium sp. B2-7-3]|nr:pyrroloquinoline quinone-dependent dehydrogenase [Mesorhizobium sp. B2-7-3]